MGDQLDGGLAFPSGERFQAGEKVLIRPAVEARTHEQAQV